MKNITIPELSNTTITNNFNRDDRYMILSNLKEFGSFSGSDVNHIKLFLLQACKDDEIISYLLHVLRINQNDTNKYRSDNRFNEYFNIINQNYN